MSEECPSLRICIIVKYDTYLMIQVKYSEYGVYCSLCLNDLESHPCRSYRTFVIQVFMTKWGYIGLIFCIYTHLVQTSCQTAPAVPCCCENRAAHSVPNVCYATVRLGRHTNLHYSAMQTRKITWLSKRHNSCLEGLWVSNAGPPPPKSFDQILVDRVDGLQVRRRIPHLNDTVCSCIGAEMQ